jgi:hypothetical protein
MPSLVALSHYNDLSLILIIVLHHYFGVQGPYLAGLDCSSLHWSWLLGCNCKIFQLTFALLRDGRTVES